MCSSDLEHTIGDQTEYSTPGTRTKPQDPSLPLLRDDDDDDGGSEYVLDERLGVLGFLRLGE